MAAFKKTLVQLASSKLNPSLWNSRRCQGPRLSPPLKVKDMPAEWPQISLACCPVRHNGNPI